MSVTMYSVEQVAEILGLHVRTVRGYVRDGRLPAVRVGKQYRIAQRDFETFAGVPAGEPASSGPRAHVSTVVHIESVARPTMDRITTHVSAAASGDLHRSGQLDVHFNYDESDCRLTIFVVGDVDPTAAILELIGTVTRQGES
jgi:excisionase family DNA binding protein